MSGYEQPSRNGPPMEAPTSSCECKKSVTDIVNWFSSFDYEIKALLITHKLILSQVSYNNN